MSADDSLPVYSTPLLPYLMQSSEDAGRNKGWLTVLWGRIAALFGREKKVEFEIVPPQELHDMASEMMLPVTKNAQTIKNRDQKHRNLLSLILLTILSLSAGYLIKCYADSDPNHRCSEGGCLAVGVQNAGADTFLDTTTTFSTPAAHRGSASQIHMQVSIREPIWIQLQGIVSDPIKIQKERERERFSSMIFFVKLPVPIPHSIIREVLLSYRNIYDRKEHYVRLHDVCNTTSVQLSEFRNVHSLISYYRNLVWC